MNYKQQVIAKELESILAIRTRLATAYTEDSAGEPVTTVGDVSGSGNGAASIRIHDQRNNVDAGWDALPGFSTNQQGVFTTGVAQIVIQSTGTPAPGGPTNAFATVQVVAPVGAQWATASVLLAAVAATDIVVVNGVTFTCVAGAPGANEFQDDALDSVVATNLAAAINASVTAGVAGVITAQVDATVPEKVNLIADAAGVAGNAYTLSTTDAPRVVVSGATFGLGAGTTLGVAGHHLHINGAVFTAEATTGLGYPLFGGGANKFDVGATDADTAQNLLQAINATADVLIATLITAWDEAHASFITTTDTIQVAADGYGTNFDGLYAISDGGAASFVVASVSGTHLDGATDGASTYTDPLVFMTLVAECALRGLKVELYMTPSTHRPTVANFASWVLMGSFDINPYWPLSGRV